MKKILLLTTAFLMVVLNVRGQGCASDTVYKWVNGAKVEFTDTERANGVQLSCDNPFDSLYPSVFAYGDPDAGYTYESIPYEPPFAFNSGTEVVLPKDDCWGKVFGLGYNRPPEPAGTPSFFFNFYGQNYQNVSVSSNGNLRFIAGAADYGNYVTPESAVAAADYTYCPFATSNPFPDSRTMWGGYANPTLGGVSGPFHDIYFYGSNQYPGHMYFQVIGDYPCRKIVLSYYQVPLFGNTSQIATHMMVLYETTNVIEFYMQNKPAATSTNGGNAVLGIQNMDGTQATVIPGYNNTEWTAQNEAWRIRPMGELAHVVEWYKRPSQGPTAGQLIGPLPTDAQSRTVAQPTYEEGPTMYIAKATIYRLDGEEFDVYDSILYRPYDIRPTTISHKSNVLATAIASRDYRDIVCKGEAVKFQLTGGDRYYVAEPEIYANNPIIDSTVILNNIQNQDSVKYVFMYENLDEDGLVICTRYDSCVIYNYSFSIGIGDDTTICQGESVTYTEITDNEEGTYLWSTGATTKTVTYEPQSTEVLSLTLTNKYGCTATASANVIVNQAPEVEILGTFDICNGATTKLTAQSSLGNCVYQWSTGETTSSINVSPNVSTEYEVSVKFPPAMCETIVSQMVNVKNAPEISCNEDQKICYGETAPVMVVTTETEPLRYVWISTDEAVNGSTATAFTVSPQGTTHYTVTAYNDINCNTTDEVIVYVEQKPVPIITFSPKAIDALDPMVVFTDSTVGSVSTLWELSDGSSSTDRVFIHTFELEDGVISYDVTLTSETEFGCVDSVTTLIRVKRDHYLWAPTAVYLHDSDIKNRTFRLHIDNLIEYNIKIYNRWGTLLFETDNVEDAWDCMYNGKNVQQGVYVWKATYRHNDSPNRQQSETGTFMIYN
ncbi:MAG: gliding motility-associated C-terminal domain-containing protein [Bacteroidales bacterium]|nr:gliding motility-associated C-terminal domain-containing protein [Candidatus Scybalousia scybalohippi]